MLIIRTVLCVYVLLCTVLYRQTKFPTFFFTHPIPPMSTSIIQLQLANVEITANQVRVTAVLKQGNDAMKELQQAVQLEDVEKLMEDSAEAADYLQQLTLMLGQSLTNDDEAASEAELRRLEKEIEVELRDEMPSVPVSNVEVALPAVPQHVPGSVQKERERNQLPSTETLLAA